MDDVAFVHDLAKQADSDGLPATARRCREIAAELDRLQAIVAKLPVTADGVPVMPGMKVFYDICGVISVMRVDSVELHGERWLLRQFGVVTRDLTDCYSTQAAAAAAGGE